MKLLRKIIFFLVIFINFPLLGISQVKNGIIFKPFMISVNDCGLINTNAWLIKIYAIDYENHKTYEFEYDLNTFELKIDKDIFNNLPTVFKLRVLVFQNNPQKRNFNKKIYDIITTIEKEEMLKSKYHIKLYFYTKKSLFGFFKKKSRKSYYVIIDYGNGSSILHLYFPSRKKINTMSY